MSQTNVRRSSGRRVQQKKSNSNRNLIIGAVVGVVVLMVAAGLALSRSSGGSVAGFELHFYVRGLIEVCKHLQAQLVDALGQP